MKAVVLALAICAAVFVVSTSSAYADGPPVQLAGWGHYHHHHDYYPSRAYYYRPPVYYAPPVVYAPRVYYPPPCDYYGPQGSVSFYGRNFGVQFGW
jgi:hypothetical protein